MLDRIKVKLEKINIKEKELEQKLNSDQSFKGYESRISDLEHSKKELLQQISELEIKNDAYLQEIENLREANDNLHDELKNKSPKPNEDLDDQFDILREKEEKIKEMMEVVNNTIAIKQKSLEDWEKELMKKQREYESLNADIKDKDNLEVNNLNKKIKDMEKSAEIKQSEISKIQEKFKLLEDKYKMLKLQLSKMSGFVNQFPTEQLTNLQKSELELINKLIINIKQNESNNASFESDVESISKQYETDLKNKINQYEHDLNNRENEINKKDEILNKQIMEIKQALGIKDDQEITALNNSVIKYRNSEKVFNDYESLIDKQEAEINSLRMKVKKLGEGGEEVEV